MKGSLLTNWLLTLKKMLKDNIFSIKNLVSYIFVEIVRKIPGRMNHKETFLQDFL